MTLPRLISDTSHYFFYNSFSNQTAIISATATAEYVTAVTIGLSIIAALGNIWIGQISTERGCGVFDV